MLKELKAHHRNIIQMSFNGFRAPEIAERLGITTITVSNVLNSPLGKAYLNGLHDKITKATIDVRKELISMNKDALATLSRLLQSKEKIPAAVQLGAAKDVLDRSGFKAPDQLNIDMIFQNKSDAEIDAEIIALEGSINKTQYGKEELSEKVEPETELIESETELIEEYEPNFDEAEDFEPLPEVDPEIATTLNDSTFDPFGNIKE